MIEELNSSPQPNIQINTVENPDHIPTKRSSGMYFLIFLIVSFVSFVIVYWLYSNYFVIQNKKLPINSAIISPTLLAEDPSIAATPSTGLQNLTKIAIAHTIVGFSLFRELSNQDPYGNISISPASVSMALSMIYFGASGETKIAMEKILAFENISQNTIASISSQLSTNQPAADDVTLTIANALWQSDKVPLNPLFVSDMKNYFNAKSTELDFTNVIDSSNKINSWVNQKTNGKIPVLVSNLPQDSLAVLTNAIYFKGLWSSPFDPKKTLRGDFISGTGKIKRIPMMEKEEKYLYLETPNFQAVQLPYGTSGTYSLCVFLPKVTFKKLNSLLTPENWSMWIDQFDQQKGTLIMPSFKIKYEGSIKNALSRMGLDIAFSKKADFTKMISDMTFGPYSIGDVIHSSFIEVNEEGTEAAAATAVIPITGGGQEPPPPFTMVVNRPFFFTIKNDITKEIYFMGAIQDPTK